MRVWVDQDLCNGDGLCEELCPQVFTLASDGLSYVHNARDVRHDPGGPVGIVAVPQGLEDSVLDAAEDCPGECIHVEA